MSLAYSSSPGRCAMNSPSMPRLKGLAVFFSLIMSFYWISIWNVILNYSRFASLDPD